MIIGKCLRVSGKVIPRVFGGMGNQLFIYAMARRLALVNDAELVIDDVSGFVNDKVYQRHFQLDNFNITCRKATANERLEPFSRVRRLVKRKLSSRRPFGTRAYLVQEGLDFDERILRLRTSGDLYLEGYWQSENYFKDIEPVIRQDLEIKPPVDEVNKRLSREISSCTAVALHLRFFDTPGGEGGNNSPASYYQSAVAKMELMVPNAHYFVFSDKPELARAIVPVDESRLTLVNHNQGDENAYADLWLMSQCQHFIIANSTFSWWGAWLAAHQDKKVIAPERISGSITDWGFEGLLPEQWMKL